MKKLQYIAFGAALALAGNAARAQDSAALLDLLVKKKVISEQEAEQTRTELAQEAAATSAGKISLSTPIKQIRLYGDGRLRYDYREGNALGKNAAGASDTASASQFRYRLRLGADVTLTDQWFLGFRLETGSTGRSGNVTYSNSGSNVAPFGKGGTATSTVVTGITTTKNAAGAITSVKTTTSSVVSKVDFGSTVFVGQAYLKYSPFSWLTVEGGKIPNPFVTSAMVWDSDINPEGFAEQFKYTFGPFGGTATAGFDKDGKTSKDVATTKDPGGVTIDLFGNFGQFVYDTASPQNQYGTTAVGRNDSWLFGYQVGARANYGKAYVQIAPTFYNYSGEKHNDFATSFNGDPGGNQTGINDLAIIDVPFELGWTWGKLPLRIFADYAVNLDGNGRASAAGHPGSGDENTAWQAGFGINKIKKKGDWELQAYWQRSEQFSVDPNLIDNDLFDAHLNLQGVVVRVGYALTDAVTVNLTYNHGEIIDKGLGTGGNGGTLNGSTSSPTQRNYNLFQADLNLKF